jgi:hypothetical protein
MAGRGEQETGWLLLGLRDQREAVALASTLVDELVAADASGADAVAFGAGAGGAELVRRDGTRLPIDYTATAAEADGAPTAIVVTFRDASARRRRERERDDDLQRLCEHAPGRHRLTHTSSATSVTKLYSR